MAKVNISNVEVLDAKSTFLSPFRFKITFECYEPLEEDLEWRLIYVSSAYNMALDQTLDSILVGPVPVGKHQFVFEADPPNTDVIPVEDAVGVTVAIVACLYRDQEFIRVGYYVNNEYADEQLRECPPDRPQYDRLARHVLADNPRVTRRGIDWGESRAADAAAAAAAAAAAVSACMAQQQQQQQQPQPHLLPQPQQPLSQSDTNSDANGMQQQPQLQSPVSAAPPEQQQQKVASAAAASSADAAASSTVVTSSGAKENCDPASAAAAAAVATVATGAATTAAAS